MSEKSLEEIKKMFQERITENYTHPPTEFPLSDEDLFVWGYQLAQKDLQSQLEVYIQLAHTKSAELDAAVKVIEFYGNDKRYTHKTSNPNTFLNETGEYISEIDFDCGASARAYLEKWK